MANTTVSKREAKKFLSDVPEENIFRCVCGHTLKNMQELAEDLATMTDESFTYHANAEKIDFANWIRDIVGDKKLVGDLVGAKDRPSAARLVSERIGLLQKKAA